MENLRFVQVFVTLLVITKVSFSAYTEFIYQFYTYSFNPLNPNIKIQILFCYPYAFSIEVVGRICWSIN